MPWVQMQASGTAGACCHPSPVVRAEPALGCRPVWVSSCFLKAQRPGLANVPDCDYLFAG